MMPLSTFDSSSEPPGIYTHTVFYLSKSLYTELIRHSECGASHCVDNLSSITQCMWTTHLFHLGVSLNVNLAAAIFLQQHGRHGLQCDLARKVTPFRDYLCSNAALYDLQNFGLIFRINWQAVCHTTFEYLPMTHSLL